MPVLAWSTFTLGGTISVTRGSSANPDAQVRSGLPRTAIAMQLQNVVPTGSQEIPRGWVCPVLQTSGGGARDLHLIANQSPLMPGRTIVVTRASLFLAGIDESGAAAWDWGLDVWLTKGARTAQIQWWFR